MGTQNKTIKTHPEEERWVAIDPRTKKHYRCNRTGAGNLMMLSPPRCTTLATPGHVASRMHGSEVVKAFLVHTGALSRPAGWVESSKRNEDVHPPVGVGVPVKAPPEGGRWCTLSSFPVINSIIMWANSQGRAQAQQVNETRSRVQTSISIVVEAHTTTDCSFFNLFPVTKTAHKQIPGIS